MKQQLQLACCAMLLCIAFFKANGQSIYYDWTKIITGTNYENTRDIHIDKNGNIFSVGSFYGTFNTVSTPSFPLYNSGQTDGYLMKRNAAGTIQWVKKIGGFSQDYISQITTDNAGNIYLGGTYRGTVDLNPGPGTYYKTSVGYGDAFVLKLNASGTFQWAKTFGGNQTSENISGLVTDNAGNVYASGFFSGTIDFDDGPGTVIVSSYSIDGFVMKFTSSGQVTWVNTVKGGGFDYVLGIDVNDQGEVFSMGRFSGSADFDPGPGFVYKWAQGSYDLFVLKYDAAGNYSWVKTIKSTGQGFNYGGDIKLDKQGNIYCAGTFYSTADFDPGNGFHQLISKGHTDGFVLKLNNSGDFKWAHSFGNTMDDGCTDIAVDTLDGVYISGYFRTSADFDPAPGNQTVLASSNNKDGFTLKLDSAENFKWVQRIGAYYEEEALCVALDSSLNVYTGGVFQGTVDFDPGTGVDSYTSNSIIPHAKKDAYIQRIGQCLSATQTSITATACGSYTSPDGNDVWTTTGTYKDTLQGIRGCDSVVIIDLTIKQHSAVTIIKEVCNQYVSPSGNYTWTTSGTYQDTISNSVGCDSVLTVNLTIKQKSTASFTTSACSQYTSPSGKLWMTSGTFIDTIPNAVGCDSIMTFLVTIKNPTSHSISPTACGQYTSPSGNYTWTSSGTYQDTISNSVGCDSVITISLTVKPTSSNTINPIVCGQYTSPSGNYTWTTSGTYQDTIPNAVGCDSIMTIQLTVKPHSAATIFPIVCGQYVSPSGNYTWTTSGTYQDTLPNSIGCDSVVTMFLTVNNSTTSSLNKTVCGQYVSPSGNHTWTTSGTYQDTIPNALGCDSVMTIQLVVNQSSASTINKTACNQYVSPSGNHTWTTSGTYQDTIPNALGCDSVMTIQLVVNSSSASTINKTACNQYVSPSGNHTWTTSGTYQDTIPNDLGCDSVMTIQLVVNPSSTSTINKTVCGQYVSPSGNYTWTASGTYQDTIPNALGCDSVMTIQLVVNQSSTSTINKTVCGQYVSPSGNYTWTTSGTYQDTIPNALGCDSVMTIQLVVNQASTSTINKTTCGQYVSPSGNYTWTTSGTYQDTIPNALGCDSVMIIQLVVNQASTSTINKTVCNQYVSPSGNYTWTTSGTYKDTIPNALGCDSIVTIQLTINKVDDLSVTKNGNELIAEANNATYQWIDCVDNSVINGATDKRFTPQKNGKYAAIITQKGCSDTTACTEVVLVGVDERNWKEDIQVYPNPTNGFVTIDLGQNRENTRIEVRNIAGQLVHSNITNGATQYSFEMNNPAGIYFVTILAGEKKVVFKLTKF